MGQCPTFLMSLRARHGGLHLEMAPIYSESLAGPHHDNDNDTDTANMAHQVDPRNLTLSRPCVEWTICTSRVAVDTNDAYAEKTNGRAPGHKASGP